jgi:ubiquitin carboxyl-terminal hydrolase 25/28
VTDSLSLLKDYSSQLSNQCKEMEVKVDALQNQIKVAYGTSDMQKMPYHLHSICVHDGNANSGHYYTLIYDRF